MGVISTDSVVVVQPELVTAPLGDEELVLLQVETGRYYGLNSLGREVWELIQQPRRVTEIVERITSAYEVDATRCEADVLALSQEMVQNRLISVREHAAR